MFEITSSGIPQNMKMEFLDLQSTLGVTSPKYSDLSFFSLTLSDYGLTAFNANSLDILYKKLAADSVLTKNYAIAKLGFNPSDKTQYAQGLQLLKNIDLVTNDQEQIGEFLCQMSKSLDF